LGVHCAQKRPGEVCTSLAGVWPCLALNTIMHRSPAGELGCGHTSWRPRCDAPPPGVLQQNLLLYPRLACTSNRPQPQAWRSERTLRRPRWGMPISRRRTPRAAQRSTSASRPGSSASQPSMPNRCSADVSGECCSHDWERGAVAASVAWCCEHGRLPSHQSVRIATLRFNCCHDH